MENGVIVNLSLYVLEQQLTNLELKIETLSPTFQDFQKF